jgi:hypothetical protein
LPFISASVASLRLVGCPNWLWLGRAVPYRRFAIGGPLDTRQLAKPIQALQNAILRYSRLEICATLKQFTINQDFGTICWGEDMDIAPETLYYEVVGVPSPAMLHEAPSEYGRKPK